MSEPLGSDTVLVVMDDALSTTIEGEAVIMDSSEGVYHGLNEVGSKIWDQLSTPTTVAEVQETIVAEYDVDPERCRRETREYLATLVEKELVEVVDEPNP
jgi:hypothetical protein